MGKLSKRMKRLLAILLVEVIVASNVFISYADEDDDGIMYQISEEDIADEVGDEPIVAYSDGDEEEEHVEDDSSDETSDEEEYTEDVSSGEEEDFSNEEEISSEENNGSGDPAQADGEDVTEEEPEEPDEEDGFEAVECICDTVCTSDSYNVNCPVCVDAVDADDVDAFFADHCKGEKEEKTEEPDEEEKIEPEIISVDNSVSVTAVCVVDGEEIEEAGSFEINVEGTVDVLEKAPEIEGYTFADKATVKDDGSDITQIQKESVEEKEETEIDGKKVVTKITTTTSMSYYDGTQWKDLEDDITVAFEYTQNEETDEETAAVKFIASFVDQDGNAIEGYTNKTLTFDDTLDLTKAPVTIENYEYVEAQIGDAVISSINKKTETNEKGEEVVAYSYTADGEEVEVNEDTEVTLVYEGGEEAVEAEVTLICVDEEGLAIAGYEKAELPEFAEELILDDPEKAPVVIEGYDYKEAMVDGAVITSLVKEAAEESDDAETEEGVFVYSYVTKDGETVVIEEDTEITLSYEEAEVAVLLDATIVDEFGDEIAEKYTNMDISKIFDKNDELTLDDPETPPVKKVSVRQSLFKTIKYTYVKASVNDEIIKGLQRKAIESEDVKASDREYAYSYTTDGETWEKIKEDTTVIFEYSDGKKTTYTYEDSFVSVTATLQHANAIPDDAEFVVTPVTPSTSGYNYDAYMEALNANADQIGNSDKKESSDKDAKKYTEDNTLLYDIAFLAEQVDEEGNAIEGSKVEYQPAEGMVKISFTFKQKQLEDDLNAERAGDVTVVHMPLADDVKESAGTTADATGISASDVNLEVVAASTSVTAEVVDFSLSNFSVSAFVADGVKALKPGTTVSIEGVLGEAVNYGIVANELTFTGDLESNFATGLLHGNAAMKACRNEHGGAGATYIGEYDGSSFIMDPNSNDGYVMIYTTEEAMRNFGSNMISRPGVIIDYTTYSESEIKKKVSDMVNNVVTASANLKSNGDSQGYEYSEVKDQWSPVIDIAELGKEKGTYYINFQNGQFPGSDYTIKIKSGQNVVLNIPDSEVTFGQFHLVVDGVQHTTHANSNEEIIVENVIFNCPNATVVNTSSPSTGTFLAPKATFTNYGVAAGFLVADKATIGNSEWHTISKRIPVVNPTSFVLRASKTVNGQTPAAEENGKFTFSLFSIAEDGAETFIEEVTNNGGSVEFAKFDNIKEQGTYWYKIQETGKAEGMDDYSIDNTLYYAKVDVSAVTEGLITNTNAKVTYYKDSKDGEVVSAPTFNNTKEEKGSITVSKVVIGESAPANAEFYFTLKDDKSGNFVEKDGRSVHVIKANESVTFTGLEYGTYTLTETDINGNRVSTSKDFAYKVDHVEQVVTIGEGAKDPVAVITNNYYEPTGSWTPNVKKNFNIKDATDIFNFTISGYGVKNGSATVTGAGSVEFETITYSGLDAVGEYEYTIKETEGTDDSITYDPAIYVVTVKVSVNSADENKLKIEIISITKNGEPYSGEEIVFTNTYEAKGSTELVAKKRIDGNPANGDETFIFELYKLTSENDDATGVPYKIATNSGENVTFSLTDEYDENDINQTFWYLIKEQKKNKETGYVTDTGSFKVSVLVTVDPNNKSNLLAEPTYHNGEAIFNNTTYIPASVPVTAVKMLENGSIDQYREKFSFELWQITGQGKERTEKLLQTVLNGENANSAAGAVEFSPLNYTRADIGKTYTYEIKEVVGTEKGIRYDEGHTVTFTVVVSYDADKQTVVATPTYSENGTVTFTNRYIPTPVSASLNVNKRTEVPDGIEADLDKMTFTFVVKDGNGGTVATGTSKANGSITFDKSLEFSKGGDYRYTIEEVKTPECVGIGYDSQIITAAVHVPDNYDGTLGIPEVKYYDQDGNGLTTPSFENKYIPHDAEIQFSGTKALNGRDWANSEKFIFGLWEGTTASGNPKYKAEATAESKTFSFDKLVFTQTGTYEYTVKEMLPEGATTNVVDGITYDTKEYHVKVTVKDDGSGQLKVELSGDLANASGFDFTNTYDVSGKFQLAVYKTVDGEKPADNEKFTFELRDASGNRVGEAKQNGTYNGEKDIVLFDEISYAKEGIYEYTVKEVNTINGYTNDSNVYTAKVTVRDDNHNGEFTISCQYYSNGSAIGNPVTDSGEAVATVNNISPSDGEALIVASKSLNGGTLKEGMFTFTLSSENDAKLAERVSELAKRNDGNGTVSFGPLKYTKADLGGATEKIYEYTIMEENDGKDYIGYDPQATRTVRIKVYLDDTEIKTDVSYIRPEGDLYKEDKGAVFHNDYKGEGTFSIEGSKDLLGGTQERNFTFDLYNEGGIDPIATDTIQVRPGETVAFKFENVALNEMGDHTYVVKERIPDGAVRDLASQTAVYQGVTYSTKEYKVTVHMDDAGNGHFVQNKDKTVYADGPISITNKYKTADTSINIYGNKNLTGRTGKDLQQDEFRFGLYENGVLVEQEGLVNPVWNNKDGSFSFHIDYKEAGTHNYVIKEIPQGTLDENGKLNNIHYDETAVGNGYPVTVAVEDNNEGKLVASITTDFGKGDNPVTITNHYEAELDVVLSATKTVNGSVPSVNERNRFAFVLSGDGVSQTVTNGAGEGSSEGSITFGPIHYTQSEIGKHVYTVSEIGRPVDQEAASAQETEIYEYSKLIYTVTIDVFVNETGMLDKTITYALGDNNATDMVFDNQKHLPSELVFSAKKVLSGTNGGTPTLQENMFRFKLTSTGEKRDSRIPEAGIEVRNNGAGEVSFTAIEYNLNDIDKTYEYVIEEILEEKKGVTYDQNLTRKITVVVGTDADGNVKPVMTCEGDKEMTDSGEIPVFTNTYAASGSFTPKVTKTLTGRDMAAGEFEFVLEGNGISQTAVNSAATDGQPGAIDFSSINYTLKDARTEPYVYTVSEVKTNKVGVTYSQMVYTITVTVTDNGDGTLDIVDTYSPEVVNKTMAFTNTYDAKGGITLTGTKTLTGRNMEAREFNFVVMEGNIQVATGTNTSASNGKESAITFTEIPYTLDDLGDHTYTITEVPSNLKGVAANDQSFTVVVNVVDEKNGNLKASVKSITGFNSSGEEIDKIAFENTYTASVSLELEALKTVNGSSELADGQTFTFTLEGGLEGKMVSQSKTNGKDGKVTFDPISYDQQDIDKTFIYTVKESAEGKKKGYTYDGTVYTVEVTVVRDDTAANGLRIEKVVKAGQGVRSDGVISFNNTYPRAGRLDLQAYKDYNGQLVDGMFSFILKGPKLPADGQTKSNVGNTVTFDVIPLDESDVGETYVYTITEQTDESKKDYVSYDEKLSRSVTVEVGVENGEVKATSIRYSSAGKYTEDDGRNMAIFHNTYKANASLNLVGTKTLTGRLLTENDKFDFVVIDKNKETDNVVATGVNNGKDITFSPITYDQSQIGKSYTYQIKELVKDGSGIYCDRTIYEMTVKVTDPNHDGTLVLEYSYPTGGLVFNNTYTATDGEIEFTGTKKMTGRELTENDHFTFAVYEVINGQEVAVPVTTGTSTGSVITFGKIRYDSLDDVGIHTYHVKEAAYGQNGVKSIDGVVRTVKVNVSDGGNGKLDAVLTSDSEAIEFTNEYHATGELQLEAWKTVNGAAPGNREFSFTLSNDKDGKTDTTNNAGDGHVVFGKITFTEKDVVKSPITYTIEENVPTGEAVVEGMVYDQSKYTVTVELVDDGKGNITVNPETIKYVKDGQELDNALFNNTYEANGQIVIEASKRLEGGNLKDDQFTFILKDENGVEIDRVTNKGTNVTFKSITYTLEDVGPHAYTVEEYHAGATGYTYDGTIFTVNVNVVDNGPGELSVTKEYVGVDGIPEFVNGYIPMEIEISKVDAVSLNELAGASMSIIGENGETLDAWVSDGGRHVFKADYDKTYTLTETAAPAGFLIADSITFRIDSDGVLWIMQADGSFAQQADSVVTMVDVAAPTPTPTPTPSDEPTPTPGDEPTPTPGDEPTPTPGDEPTPTPGDGPTPTPGDGPTPTPGENPTPGTQITPPPGNGQTPAPGDEDVLGARRGRGAVLGARRAPRTAVLGARRRPATGDTLALFIWIMVLSLSMGGAVVSSTMLKYNGKKRKR